MKIVAGLINTLAVKRKNKHSENCLERRIKAVRKDLNAINKDLIIYKGLWQFEYCIRSKRTAINFHAPIDAIDKVQYVALLVSKGNKSSLFCFVLTFKFTLYRF